MFVKTNQQTKTREGVAGFLPKESIRVFFKSFLLTEVLNNPGAIKVVIKMKPFIFILLSLLFIFYNVLIFR